MTQTIEEKTENKNKMLQYIKEHKNVTVFEIKRDLNTSHQLTIYHLTNLERAGLIGRESFKSRQTPTRWFITENGENEEIQNLGGVLVKRIDKGNDWLNAMMGYRQNFDVELKGKVFQEKKIKLQGRRKMQLGIGSSFALFDGA